MTIIFLIIAVVGTGFAVRRKQHPGMLGSPESADAAVARAARLWAPYGARSVGAGLTEEGWTIFVWVSPRAHARFPRFFEGHPVQVRHIARAL